MAEKVLRSTLDGGEQDVTEMGLDTLDGVEATPEPAKIWTVRIGERKKTPGSRLTAAMRNSNDWAFRTPGALISCLALPSSPALDWQIGPRWLQCAQAVLDSQERIAAGSL